MLKPGDVVKVWTYEGDRAASHYGWAVLINTLVEEVGFGFNYMPKGGERWLCEHYPNATHPSNSGGMVTRVLTVREQDKLKPVQLRLPMMEDVLEAGDIVKVWLFYEPEEDNEPGGWAVLQSATGRSNQNGEVWVCEYHWQFEYPTPSPRKEIDRCLTVRAQDIIHKARPTQPMMEDV